MSYQPTYVSGDYKADCDVCGRTYKASKLRKRWDGLMVCEGDFENRQPQDFVRAKADLQAPPWTRPEPSDTFIQIVANWVVPNQYDSVNVSDSEFESDIMYDTVLDSTTGTTDVFGGMQYLKLLGLQEDNASINGTALNVLALNGNATVYSSDTVSTDSWHVQVTPGTYLDSVTPSESFSSSKITMYSKALNGSYINLGALG